MSVHFEELIGKIGADKSHGVMCFKTPKLLDCQKFKIIDELVRLPYKECWIECEGTVFGFPGDEKQNGVVGCLLSEKEKGGFNAFLFSRTNVNGLVKWKKGFRFMWSPDFDGEFGIVDESEEGGFGYPEGVTHDQINFNDYLDWVGGFLSALNCSNVSRIRHDPPPKLQKARIRRGKRPLFSYWTLEVGVSSEKNTFNCGGTHSSPRVHLRRGHPRQYQNGKWCWVQACVVGEKKNGVVHKDYLMK